MKVYLNSQDATGAWVGYNDGKTNTNLLGEVNEPWSMQDYIHRINTELVLQPHCLFGFDIIGSVPSSSDVAWTINILYSVHTSEDPLTRAVTVTLLGDDSASTPGTDSVPDLEYTPITGEQPDPTVPTTYSENADFFKNNPYNAQLKLSPAIDDGALRIHEIYLEVPGVYAQGVNDSSVGSHRIYSHDDIPHRTLRLYLTRLRGG